MGTPLSDPVAEGLRLWEAGREAAVAFSLAGGVAIAATCPSATKPPLARDYADIDLAIHGSDVQRLTDVLLTNGYEAAERFNATRGHRRLLFWDRPQNRQVDVFVDVVELCHEIDLRDRVRGDQPSLPLADLLLMKLQVVETNEKDLLDIVAILHDHEFDGVAEIDTEYLGELLGNDWGLWRTTREVCGKVPAFVAGLDGLERPDLVVRRAESYLELSERAEKSRKWKMRARVGERKRWYRTPEEVG